MRLLISKEDFFEYENIVTHTDAENVMPYVLQAQKFDLPNVINQELIDDIMDNMGSTQNIALLPYVKPVLVYYSFARYVLQRIAFDTPYGFVQKTNEFSQPASEKAIQRIATEAKSLASAYAIELVEFLCDNKTTYTLYEGAQAGAKRGTIAKISGISKI